MTGAAVLVHSITGTGVAIIAWLYRPTTRRPSDGKHRQGKHR